MEVIALLFAFRYHIFCVYWHNYFLMSVYNKVYFTFLSFKLLAVVIIVVCF